MYICVYVHMTSLSIYFFLPWGHSHNAHVQKWLKSDALSPLQAKVRFYSDPLSRTYFHLNSTPPQQFTKLRFLDIFIDIEKRSGTLSQVTHYETKINSYYILDHVIEQTVWFRIYCSNNQTLAIIFQTFTSWTNFITESSGQGNGCAFIRLWKRLDVYLVQLIYVYVYINTFMNDSQTCIPYLACNSYVIIPLLGKFGNMNCKGIVKEHEQNPNIR